MAVNDPIADMLNRIRNAVMLRRESVVIPSSAPKMAIARVLKSEGFIADYQLVKGKVQGDIKISLKYYDKKTPVISGMERVSKPGLRVYLQKQEIPRLYGGLGVAIISTNKGVMTGKEAWRDGLGGEFLCSVW
ncbi:MAG: 30S ribosomal protein S8 [Chloroflexota bacterium]